MKLSALFARYLYQRKQLSLPGIGVFSIDPSVNIPDPADKNYSDVIRQIRYEQKPVLSVDDDLINFIRTETGKIKPLAESDLDSFLSDGKILLNIGKPFHIEGVGSLMKTKSGMLEFTAGDPAQPKMEGFYNETNYEDGAKKKTAYREERSSSAGSRKWLVAAAVIAGLVLVVWGGYSLYNRNAARSNDTALQQDTDADAASNPSRANVLLDSVKKIIDSSKVSLQQSSTPGNYRFIIERTASRPRALKRFGQLKDSRTGIKMSTQDSTLFTLYFSLPAKASDTLRIRDSLKTWYGRKQVFVEPD